MVKITVRVSWTRPSAITTLPQPGFGGSAITYLIFLIVENAGLKRTDSWFVESVSVADEKGGKWLCPCNQWLSLFHSDCQVGASNHLEYEV